MNQAPIGSGRRAGVSSLIALCWPAAAFALFIFIPPGLHVPGAEGAPWGNILGFLGFAFVLPFMFLAPIAWAFLLLLSVRGIIRNLRPGPLLFRSLVAFSCSCCFLLGLILVSVVINEDWGRLHAASLATFSTILIEYIALSDLYRILSSTSWEARVAIAGQAPEISSLEKDDNSGGLVVRAGEYSCPKCGCALEPGSLLAKSSQIRWTFRRHQTQYLQSQPLAPLPSLRTRRAWAGSTYRYQAALCHSCGIGVFTVDWSVKVPSTIGSVLLVLGGFAPLTLAYILVRLYFSQGLVAWLAILALPVAAAAFAAAFMMVFYGIRRLS